MKGTTLNAKTITLVAAAAVGVTVAGCSSAAPASPAAVTVTQTVEASAPAATVTVEVTANPKPAVTKTVEVLVTPNPAAAQPKPAAPGASKATAKHKTVIPLQDPASSPEIYGSLYPEDGTDTGSNAWMKYTAPDWSGGAPKWWKVRIDFYYDMAMCRSIKSILNTLPAYETDIRAIIVQEASYKGTCT